jgi:hypothetical protein
MADSKSGIAAIASLHMHSQFAKAKSIIGTLRPCAFPCKHDATVFVQTHASQTAHIRGHFAYIRISKNP